jgi:hypothetical protein
MKKVGVKAKNLETSKKMFPTKSNDLISLCSTLVPDKTFVFSLLSYGKISFFRKFLTEKSSPIG